MHKRMKRLVLTLLSLLVVATTMQAYELKVVDVPSPAMDKYVPVTVITPDGYNPTQRYDVVYLLHGYSDNHESWPARGKVGPHADRYNLIFVCPNGNNSWYWDSPIDPTFRYETFVAKELVEWIDANYSTNATRTGRAITGLSMGGHGALYLALRHQEVFGAAGSTSGGVDIRPFDDWEIATRLGSKEEHPEHWEAYTVTNMLDRLSPEGSLALIIDCGTEDFFYEVNCELHAKLLERKIPHDFYVRPGAHNWHYWVGSIEHQLLFFDNYFKKN